MANPGFQTSGRKGFQITFENGWTVSVQFGYGNYSSNYDWQGENPGDPLSRHQDQAPKSGTAEIAAWDADGNWLKFPGGDTVEGWKAPAEVLAFMGMIAAKAPAEQVSA